jgi:hypothetical protein
VGTWRLFSFAVPSGAASLFVDVGTFSASTVGVYVRRDVRPTSTLYTAIGTTLQASGRLGVAPSSPTPGVYYVGVYTGTYTGPFTVTPVVTRASRSLG